LCEPSPSVFDNLRKNRPTSICCSNPVYNKSGVEVVFDVCIHPMFSGISCHIDKWKDRVDKNKTQIKLITVSLTDLLKRYSAPAFIEYLSLDTEGSEYEILKTFDFKSYIFGLIDVEHNYVEPRRTQIRSLLLSNGYIFIGAVRFDDQYKHSSLIKRN